MISFQGDLDLFGHRSPFLPDLQQWEWDPRRPTLSQGKQDWIAVWGENQKNCGQIFNMIEIQVGRAPLQDSSVQWVFQVGSQLKIHKSNWNRLPCHALNMPCANLCKRTFFRICWLKTKNHSNLGWAWPDCSQRRCGKRRSSNSGRLKITCVCITYYVLCMQMHTHMFHGYCFLQFRLGGLTRTRCWAIWPCTELDPGTKVIVIIIVFIFIVIRQLYMQSSWGAFFSWRAHRQSSYPRLWASRGRAQWVGSTMFDVT